MLLQSGSASILACAANTAHPQGFALRAKSAFEGPVVVGFAS